MESEKEGARKGNACSSPSGVGEEISHLNITMPMVEAAFRDQSPEGDTSVKTASESVFSMHTEPLLAHGNNPPRTVSDDKKIRPHESLGTEEVFVDSSTEVGSWKSTESPVSSEVLSDCVYKARSESCKERSPQENTYSVKTEQQQQQQQQQQHQQQQQQRHQQQQQQQCNYQEEKCRQDQNEDHEHAQNRRETQDPLQREPQPQNQGILEIILQDHKPDGEFNEPQSAQEDAEENLEVGDEDEEKDGLRRMRVLSWAKKENSWDTLSPEASDSVTLFTPPSPLSTISSSFSSSDCLKAGHFPQTASIKGRQTHHTALASDGERRNVYEEWNLISGWKTDENFDPHAINFNLSTLSHLSSKSTCSLPFDTSSPGPLHAGQTDHVAIYSNFDCDLSRKQERDNTASQQTDFSPSSCQLALPGFESSDQPPHEALRSDTQNEPSATDKAYTSSKEGFSLKDARLTAALPDKPLRRSASTVQTSTPQSHSVTPKFSRSEIELFSKDSSSNQEIGHQHKGVSLYMPQFPIVRCIFHGKDQKPHSLTHSTATVAVQEHAEEKGSMKCVDVVDTVIPLTEVKEPRHHRSARNAMKKRLPPMTARVNQEAMPNYPAFTRNTVSPRSRILSFKRRYATWPSTCEMPQPLHQRSRNDGLPSPALPSPANEARSLDGIQARGDVVRNPHSQPVSLQSSPPTRSCCMVETDSLTEDTKSTDSCHAPPPSPISNHSHDVSLWNATSYFIYNTPVQLWQRPINIEGSQRNGKSPRGLQSSTPRTPSRKSGKSHFHMPGLNNEVSSSRREVWKYHQEEEQWEKTTPRESSISQTIKPIPRHSNTPVSCNEKPLATPKTVEQSSKREMQLPPAHYSLYDPNHKLSLVERINLYQIPVAKCLPRPEFQGERSSPENKADRHTVKDSLCRNHIQPSKNTMNVKMSSQVTSNFNFIVPKFLEETMDRENALKTRDNYRTDRDRNVTLQNSQSHYGNFESLQCREVNAQPAPRPRRHNAGNKERALPKGGATRGEQVAQADLPPATPCMTQGRKESRHGTTREVGHDDTQTEPPPTPDSGKEPHQIGANVTLTATQQHSEPTSNIIEHVRRSKFDTPVAMKSHTGFAADTSERLYVFRKTNIAKAMSRLHENMRKRMQQSPKISSKQSILKIKELMASMDKKLEKAKKRSKMVAAERGRVKQKSKERAPDKLGMGRASSKGVDRHTFYPHRRSKTSHPRSKTRKTGTIWKRSRTNPLVARPVEKTNNDVTHAKLSTLRLKSGVKHQKDPWKTLFDENRSNTPRRRKESSISQDLEPEILRLAGRLTYFLNSMKRSEENASRKKGTSIRRRRTCSLHRRLRKNRSRSRSQPSVPDKHKRRKKWRRVETKDSDTREADTQPLTQVQMLENDTGTVTDLRDPSASGLSPLPREKLSTFSDEIESSNTFINSIIDTLVTNYEKKGQPISGTPDGSRRDGVTEFKGNNKETTYEGKHSLPLIISDSSKVSADVELLAVRDSNTQTMTPTPRSTMTSHPAETVSGGVSFVPLEERKEKSPGDDLTLEQDEFVQHFMAKILEKHKRKKKERKAPKEQKCMTETDENLRANDTHADTETDKRAANDEATKVKASFKKDIQIEHQGTSIRPHIGKKLQVRKKIDQLIAMSRSTARFADNAITENRDMLGFGKRSSSQAGDKISSFPDLKSKPHPALRKAVGFSFRDVVFWTSLLKASDSKLAQTKPKTSPKTPTALPTISSINDKRNQSTSLTTAGAQKPLWSSAMIPNSNVRPFLPKGKGRHPPDVERNRLSKTPTHASAPSSEKPGRKKGSDVTGDGDPPVRSLCVDVQSATEDERTEVVGKKAAGDDKENEKLKDESLADLVAAGVFSLDHMAQLHPELACFSPLAVGCHTLLLPSQHRTQTNRQPLPCTK